MVAVLTRLADGQEVPRAVVALGQTPVVELVASVTGVLQAGAVHDLVLFGGVDGPAIVNRAHGARA